MRGDAYDCAKANVLVNYEPVSPHHESDAVHKDNPHIIPLGLNTQLFERRLVIKNNFVTDCFMPIACAFEHGICSRLLSWKLYFFIGNVCFQIHNIQLDH